MAFIDRLLGDPQAVAEHKAARDELERETEREIARGRTVEEGESDEWLAANRAVAEAEQRVPWWRR